MAGWRQVPRAVLQNPRAMRAFDRATSIALRAARPPFRVYERFGPVRLPVSREALRRGGIYPIPDHYYWPLFNEALLTRPLSDVRNLPGIDLRHDEQVALLDELVFADELVPLQLDRAPASALDPYIGPLSNFDSGDAEFLYQMIRRFKPRRVVEIGSGDSTKIAQLALRRNAEETGEVAEHVCVEPYEMPWLEQSGVRVIRAKVEDVGLELFAELGRDDLLFIDSSHMIRPQGDVLFEYLEVLPSLASGVLVHVHDIFTPRDYLQQWIHESVRMWNEQYLLGALMRNSDRYEVVAALNYLHHDDYARLAALCPYLVPEREPASFYLRVR